MPMMRKRGLLILLLLIGSVVFAQSKKVDLPWAKQARSSKTNFSSAPQKKISQSLNLRWDHNGPQYTERWEDRGPVKPVGVRVIKEIWGEPSTQDLSLLSGRELPQALEVTLVSSMARESWYTSAVFNPFVRRNGRIRKIQSFELAYDYAPRPVSSRVPGISNSVLAQGNWYKFEVDQTGIYRLAQQWA